MNQLGYKDPLCRICNTSIPRRRFEKPAQHKVRQACNEHIAAIHKLCGCIPKKPRQQKEI